MESAFLPDTLGAFERYNSIYTYVDVDGSMAMAVFVRHQN